MNDYEQMVKDVEDCFRQDYLRQCSANKIVKELEKYLTPAEIFNAVIKTFNNESVNKSVDKPVKVVSPVSIKTSGNKVAISRLLSRGCWEMSYREKRLLTFAISKFDYSKQKVNRYYNGELLPLEMVVIDVQEYIDFIGLSHSLTLRELRDVGKNLSDVKISIQEGSSFETISPVESYHYNGVDAILVRFSDKMLKHIDGFNDDQSGHLKGYVSYKINDMIGLKLNAWRLYEVISGYNPANVAININDLKFFLNCSGISTSSFFQKNLNPSIESLNNSVIKNLSYTKNKKGRSISGVTFFIT